MASLANKISRRQIVGAVSICFLVTALVIPIACHLPRWIEAEIVLGAWWLVWIAVLSWLLYHGVQVEDDDSAPRSPIPNRNAKSKDSFLDSDLSIFGLEALCESLGCLFSEGCLVFAGTLTAIIFIGVALFYVVEFALPGVVYLLLVSIGGMLAKVANDEHECQGKFSLSVFWGSLWATVYTGPAVVLIMVIVIALREIHK